MNSLYSVTSTIIVLLISGLSYGTTDVHEPLDSTSNILEKTAAAYLIEEGKTLYQERKYRPALTKFREASIKDPNSWRASYWVGKCHYRLNNYGYAVKYSNIALKLGNDKITDEVYYFLGSSYHRLSNLDTALINYELAKKKLSKSRVKTLRIDILIDQCKYAQELNKSEPVVVRESISGEVNTGFGEYGVVIVNDGKTIYFTSRRNNTTGGGQNPDDQEFFEDIYRGTLNENTGDWEDITNELGRLNTDGFDALNYMSDDGTYGVMTLNTTTRDIKKTTNGSDLCEIKLNSKGLYNKPKPISNKSINTSFFEGAATLTADGNTMYFVTDRKGDKSSTDIYVVRKVGKSWGEAEPLPFHINTTGRETTPYITPDGKYLFFSSDGHIGMGGLDIYVCENKGKEWGDPVNLGLGINTVNNDSHFVYSEDSKLGYISGIEVIGNKSSLDIYQMDLTDFTIPSPPTK
jgi:tetratricopeptide (TPR) repeat protein